MRAVATAADCVCEIVASTVETFGVRFPCVD